MQKGKKNHIIVSSNPLQQNRNRDDKALAS